MEKIAVGEIKLFFDECDRDVVESISQVCTETVVLVKDLWGLNVPAECHVYIMTSWYGFMFRAAPWYWTPLLILSMPLWAFRARLIWPYAGGWELRYGRRRAVGIKPPRLIQAADSSMGERVFIKQPDLDEKMQSIACHELTHAFSSHLNLPTWLKEGLAMVTVDRYFGKPTVREDTLDLLVGPGAKSSTGGRERIQIQDTDAVLYLYAHGYWSTRYIEATRPGLLKQLFAEMYPPQVLEREIAAAYSKTREAFLQDLDSMVVKHWR